MLPAATQRLQWTWTPDVIMGNAAQGLLVIGGSSTAFINMLGLGEFFFQDASLFAILP